jgi:hypothetical protein
MAGYTTHRYHHVLPEGLGAIDFASSEDSFTPEGENIEGERTKLTEEIPKTWENRKNYESTRVERAIMRLRSAAELHHR